MQEKYRSIWSVGFEKTQSAVSRDYLTILLGVWKARILREMQTAKTAVFMRFLKGSRTLGKAEIAAIEIQQSIWLCAS